MLTKPTPSDFSTTIQSPENLHSVQENFTPFHSPFSIPAFPSNDENNNSNRDEDVSTGEKEQQKLSEKRIPEIFDLVFKKDFREMLEVFLVPNHEKVMHIRFEIRQQRNMQPSRVSSHRLNSKSLEFIRKHLYQVQMQLFYSPKGRHCHLSI